MMKHSVSALVLALALLLAQSAMAEQTTYVFPYEGFRYTQKDHETVLTQTNLDEHAELIAALGTTRDAILASYIASGIVMEVIPDDGGQISVGVVSAGAYADVESMDAMSDEQRQTFAEQFSASGLYETCELTQTSPACVRMTSSAMYGSMPVYSLRYATLHLGRLYMLTQTIVGRAPETEDDLRMEQVLSGMMLLQNVSEPTPEPTPMPTATPEPTPVPTPGVAEIIASAGELTVEGVPAYTNEAELSISGRAEASASVRIAVGDQTLGTTTAKKDGTFAIRVELPEEGELMLAVMTDTAEQMLAVRYEMPCAKLEILEPTVLTFTGENVVIKGETEPDTMVYLENPKAGTRVKSDKNGSFSIRAYIDSERSEDFTLRVKPKNRKETAVTLTLTRQYTEREGIAAFREKMIALEYDQLWRNPQNYLEKQFVLRGRIMEFADYNGSPCALVCVGNPGTGIWRDPVWVVLDKEMEVAEGNVATFYMIGLGQTLPADGQYTLEGATVEAPVVKAVYCIDVK